MSNRSPVEALLILVLIAATALAYGRSFSNSFVNFDDDLYVEANPYVQTGLTFENVRWAWTTTHAANWHPLTWMSLQLDSQLFGTRPWGYHFTNVVLHIINSVLLFGVLRRLTGAVWPSGFAAGLFALHPLHVESVAWVSERKDVLSALFWMLSLWYYTAYARRSRSSDYLLALSMFALGLLAKPMVVTLPCVLLLLDYWPLRRLVFTSRPGDPASSGKEQASWRALLLEKTPFFALALLVSVITIHAQHGGGAVQSLSDIPLHQRLANVPVAYAVYLGKTIWPYTLAVFYPFPWKGVPFWEAGASVLLLTSLTVLALLQYRLRPYLLVGWLWFLGVLLPVIGIVQVGDQALADRYTYLPLVGLFLAAAWGLSDAADAMSRGRVWALSVAAVVLVACGVVTWRQVSYWHDGETLWSHAAAVTKDNYIAHDHLAEVFLLKGDEDKVIVHATEALRIRPGKAPAHLYLARLLSARGRFEEAVPHYQAAIQFGPSDASIHLALGNALLRLQRLDEARNQYARAFQLNPSSGEAANNLGTIFARQRQMDKALHCYKEAIRLDAKNSLAHNNLGLVFLERGQLGEAADEFRRALDLEPRYAAAHNNLGNAHFFRAEWQQAAQNYRQAVQLAPRSALYHFNLACALRRMENTEEAAREYREGLTLDPQWPAKAAQQAWDLATDPDPQRRQANKALLLAQQACEVLGPQTPPRYLVVQAAVYAEAGRFDEAMRTARQALQAAENAGQPQLAGEIRSHLLKYERHEPYRAVR